MSRATEVRPRQAIGRMSPYHPPLEGRGGKLRLDFNEKTTGCSRAVQRAISRISRERLSVYPEYDAAQRRLARFFRVGVQEMLLTNGTDEAIRLVLDTFLEEGETVLLAEPTFAMYRFYAELLGGRVGTVRYSNALEFPVDGAIRALRAKPKVFFIANPNNPTGTLLSCGQLVAILEAARSTLVVVDEAYFEFSGVTVLDRIRRYDNLIVIRTFSKAMGLAGLRLGCLFAGNNVAGMLRIAQPPYSVNAAAIIAAQAATADIRSVRRYVAQVRAAKRMLETALIRLGIPQFPSAANFVLVDLGETAPAVLQALRRCHILLRDRQADFGRAGYVRMTVGTVAQTRRLIRELEKVWK